MTNKIFNDFNEIVLMILIKKKKTRWIFVFVLSCFVVIQFEYRWGGGTVINFGCRTAGRPSAIDTYNCSVVFRVVSQPFETVEWFSAIIFTVSKTPVIFVLINRGERFFFFRIENNIKLASGWILLGFPRIIQVV